jgi:hypothetical protein
LRWYAANQAGIQFPLSAQTTQTEQPQPTDMAFDGTNLWVTDVTHNTVIKLGLDGTVQATVPLGGSPIGGEMGSGIAFDGSAIWVGNSFNNTVSKLRTSDKQIIGTFPVPGRPSRLMFDGMSIWVATQAGQVARLRTQRWGANGRIGIGGLLFGIAFDGANIWVSSQQGIVAKLLVSPTSSGLPPPQQFPVGEEAFGMAFDGATFGW